MRRDRPDLFCAAQTLEDVTLEERARYGTKGFTLLGGGTRLSDLINEKQKALPGLEEEVEYPPCQCGL